MSTTEGSCVFEGLVGVSHLALPLQRRSLGGLNRNVQVVDHSSRSVRSYQQVALVGGASMLLCHTHDTRTSEKVGVVPILERQSAGHPFNQVGVERRRLLSVGAVCMQPYVSYEQHDPESKSNGKSLGMSALVLSSRPYQ